MRRNRPGSSGTRYKEEGQVTILFFLPLIFP